MRFRIGGTEFGYTVAVLPVYQQAPVITHLVRRIEQSLQGSGG